MKRNHTHLFCLALLLTGGLWAGCNRATMVELRGCLYTDTTHTVPVAGAELRFGDPGLGLYGGYAVTDSLGRWGFSLISDIPENPHFSGTKLSIEPDWLYIISGADTLFDGVRGEAEADTLLLSADTCLGRRWW